MSEPFDGWEDGDLDGDDRYDDPEELYDEDDLDDDDDLDEDDLEEDEEDFDEDAGPELIDAVAVSCPYCNAEVELVVDPVGGEHQEYVEDCEVCCQPWTVRVTIGRDGVESVELSTQDES